MPIKKISSICSPSIYPKFLRVITSLCLLMDKQVREKLTLCSVAIGNIRFRKILKRNNNKILSF